MENTSLSMVNFLFYDVEAKGTESRCI